MAAVLFSMDTDWYLMRASGIVALVLLTGTFVLGIATFRRWRPAQLPRFVTASLHRSISLLAVVFLGIHIVTALVDPFAGVDLVSVVAPFGATRSAFWVALGAVAFDLVGALVVSSLLRTRIGARAWTAIHWFAYVSWPLALAHSFGMGSDAGTAWVRAVGVSCVAAIGAAILWRLSAASGVKHLQPRTAPR